MKKIEENAFSFHVAALRHLIPESSARSSDTFPTDDDDDMVGYKNLVLLALVALASVSAAAADEKDCEGE